MYVTLHTLKHLPLTHRPMHSLVIVAGTNNFCNTVSPPEISRRKNHLQEVTEPPRLSFTMCFIEKSFLTGWCNVTNKNDTRHVHSLKFVAFLFGGAVSAN